MPQIPVYEQRTVARGTAPDASSGTGAGLQALGQAISSIAADNERVRQFARQKDEEAAGVAANSDLAEAQAKWSEEFMLRRQGVQPGAENFTPTLLADFDKDSAERLKRAKTPAARAYLQQRLSAVKLSLQNQAMGFEAEERVRFRGQSLDSALDNRRKAADFNPDEFATLAAEQRAAVEASGLPLPMQAKYGQQAVERLAEASVRGLIRRNPRAALKELSDEKTGVLSVRALNPDDLLQLRAAAQAEVRRLEAEARARAAEARDSLRQAEADALAYSFAGKQATLPPRSAYIAAYGAEGADRYAKASQLLTVTSTVGAAVMMPPEQAAAALAPYAPDTQAGAADQAEIFGRAQQIYTQQRRAFETDPAGFLAARDEGVREAFGAAFGPQATPETVGAYVSQVRSAQAAAGIPEPKLLPAGVEAALASRLTFDPERPTQRSQTLAALEQVWGRNFPTLLREVAPKLDGQARVMAMTDAPTAAALDRAQAAAKDTAEIIPGDDKRAVSEAVAASVEPLARTLIAAPDRNERLREVIDAATVLALDRVSRGTSPQAAARESVSAIIDSQFEYRDTIRAPKGINADRVAKGAAAWTRAGLPGVDLGLGAPGAAGRFRTPAEMRDAAARDLARNGVWVTTREADGVQLLRPIGDGFATVTDAAGQPIVLTWEQAASAADSPAADVLGALGAGMGDSR